MARTLNRLKAKQVETLGAGRHADGGGLYLDRDDQGRSRWLFMWTRNGKRREMGLGAASAAGVSLAKAREAAAKARDAVAKGVTPSRRGKRRSANRNLSRPSAKPQTPSSRLSPRSGETRSTAPNGA